VGFCSVLWVQLFYFFSLSFKKNKCAASVLAYKNHDKKKLAATPQKACVLWVCVLAQAFAVPVGRAALLHWMMMLQLIL
jgi:hypothetical protein